MPGVSDVRSGWQGGILVDFDMNFHVCEWLLQDGKIQVQELKADVCV